MKAIKRVYEWFTLEIEAETNEGTKFKARLNLIDLVVGITAFVLLVLFCAWMLDQAAKALLGG